MYWILDLWGKIDTDTAQHSLSAIDQISIPHMLMIADVNQEIASVFQGIANLCS